MIDTETTCTCPACGTENAPMGTLGRTTHYRCSACGLGYHQHPDDPPPTRNAKDIRDMILEAHARGRYVYLVDGPNSSTRIIDARKNHALVQVKGLSASRWYTLRPTDRIETR